MRDVLVLWDVDHTLIDVDGLGREAYDLAFLRLFGRPARTQPPMAGRTDLAIALDLLRDNGVVDAEGQLEALRAAAEAALRELAHLLPSRGRVLPGVPEALGAVARFGADGVVQSLLTGNVRRIAELKLGCFGLTGHLDLDVGAYGWSHTERARLVDVARAAAAGRYGAAFAGRSTVLVGDTPLDIEAALSTGASVLAVATGRYGVAELTAAGAHAVLRDLSSTQDVLSALRTVTTC